MTVSKTTKEKVLDLITPDTDGGICGSYQEIAGRFAKFADSLTDELQKENARLREALEKIEADNGCEHNHGLIAATAPRRRRNERLRD